MRKTKNDIKNVSKAAEGARILPKKDLLHVLNVISKMEIGPVRIERHRLLAPYKVITKDESSSFELIYHYGENIFDPKEYESLNLASMIAAQVAINYGLFCKEIVFHGLFDKVDQQFIKDMMQNTAREIYVKKFLEPNPFLRGEAAQFQPVKKESYIQAEITFPDKQPSSLTAIKKDKTASSWEADSSRYLILSSGGKDSLLSFGLLRELEHEVHPVFINESGRHWYTALNAFRYFSTTFPHATKVWTNADRLFAWMLRHFPFVRKDFAKIRSDEYPIRLWTVAVFLFGALPIARNRSIGRIIIGDEFDTTNRNTFQGITHYDGLYDQSRYFDNALTRYFIRKNWGMTQFSILRPLSELFIEKILIERYPELQRHQVSCHATHIERDRVHPCGKCEKCRRIVGMLMAIDADPSHCGYSLSQVKDCLKDIAVKGVHQESAGAQHLLFLLSQKGLISQPAKNLKAREHPEILKVRFDPEKSPIDAIPVELREPLLRIFLQHGNGAAQRHGRIWIDYDPLNDPALSNPYPFKSPGQRYGAKDIKNGEAQAILLPYLLGELTWPEAQVRFKEMDVALLPVGSLEQHGPHLPLDTDAFDAFHLAKEVASACSDPKPIVMPLIPYGVSYHHADFSGTVSLTPKTLSQLVYEVGMSAAQNGVTKLVIINGHGGNIPALQFAAQMINRDAHIFTCVETGETSEKDLLALTETPNDVHAGEIETSTTLAVRPHMVRHTKKKKFIPRFSSRYLNFSSKRSVDWYARIAKISPTGVLGDPTKASREKGEKMWALMIKHVVEFVEDLKSMSLDEILHKRY
jgi:creatinine amidohydrolase/Fe(II)-dependent formamide hydrolase-like protein/7-cyano-7-deazaguanine synthase in queuosine biosynthesis